MFSRERSGVLALYAEAVADSGWRLPSSAELAYLFQTFELARVANCVVWSALAATDGVEGELEELHENEAWLASLDDVLLA